jgi:hypothetical protein
MYLRGNLRTSAPDNGHICLSYNSYFLTYFLVEIVFFSRKESGSVGDAMEIKARIHQDSSGQTVYFCGFGQIACD